MMKRKGTGLRRLFMIVPRVSKLLVSGRVPLREKLLFLIPAAVYWVWPLDAMPLIPLDDIAVTLLLAGWFSSRMEKRYLMVPAVSQYIQD